MKEPSREGWVQDSVELTRLTFLTPMEYGRVRKSKAIELGVSVATLDAEVRRLRSATQSVDQDDKPRPPEFTDEAIALQFSERHCQTMRYVAGWGRWFVWTGKQWKADETLLSLDRARFICREISAKCHETRVAAGIASAKTVAAVERLAKADRRHAATVDQWDLDVWLLNTPGGVIDLLTGKMRRHRPENYITKISAVTPGGDCPLWRAFLSKVTNGNFELQLYLQRMAGLALTGSTREHALFFAYGTGGNGKGVFLNTITGIMGEYAAVASMETFTASQSDRHPTDLAMLRGARLVTAQETEEGRRWAEAKIKAMTGGDPITARFMRQDFFTFTPQFKLIIAGNHKPGLRNVDEAIRRRLNLIPFNVKIPAAERDADLPEKLRAEWPGILLWMIDGCMLWQERGLCPPAVVLDATKEYLEAEDAMAIWLLERCEVGKTKTERSSVLFASWKAWAERGGEMPGSQKRFNQAMVARGFILGRDSTNCANFTGLCLKPVEPLEPRYWDR